MNSYTRRLEKNDPSLTLKLPKKVVQDLVKRSQENGRDVNIEIMLRLVRSLERDLKMANEDHELAVLCELLQNR